LRWGALFPPPNPNAGAAQITATQRKGEIYVGEAGAADRVLAFLIENKVL
jgi:hypothetical protein